MFPALNCLKQGAELWSLLPTFDVEYAISEV